MKSNDNYTQMDENKFEKSISELEKSHDLVCLFCAQQGKRFVLYYIFEKGKQLLMMTKHLTGTTATSIAAQFPSACWYEREIRDGFGIEFDGLQDRRPLLLHEPYPDGFHPLLKSFKNQKIHTKKDVIDSYPFMPITGEGIYHIPVGPVHAGIIEPGHFRFSVIGETIFNLEIRVFYKHRGIEKLAEGKQPRECIAIAEAISGDESVANAVAFCMAMEKISEITVSARAMGLRTILLELERIYSHLGDLAGMIIDVAYPVGASAFFILREDIFQLNELLTDSRFMRGMMDIGGLKRDIEQDKLRQAGEFLTTFVQRFKKAVEAVQVPSVIDRLDNTGIVKRELVRPLHLTGPIARAAGVAIDTRRDHPYGDYSKVPIRLGEKGDVLSRFEVKTAEISDAVAIIRQVIASLPLAERRAVLPIKDGDACSLVEAARGQTMHWVSIKKGVIDRYKVRTASFCNWRAIEHAVLGNIVPDFPLINKSMNLSYAGTDL
ncbi:NADH-quinone oxidoreductase subunit C [Candidatus Woesearchaeota archaeon]|nr:NADH-quinone oxidoreductase subunit C [Candidatus Woesearchaeota archaeon]